MNGELLARFCGQSLPPAPIVVFTPELWIHFLSDEAEVDLGFKATYYFSGNNLQILTQRRLFIFERIAIKPVLSFRLWRHAEW